jgi:cell division topological specificity factor
LIEAAQMAASGKTVIEKHFPIERENVQIKMDRGDAVLILEIDVEIPNSAGLLLSA